MGVRLKVSLENGYLAHIAIITTHAARYDNIPLSHGPPPLTLRQHGLLLTRSSFDGRSASAEGGKEERITLQQVPDWDGTVG